ncbi:MAG: DUF1549 domain-containing protein [Pirellulaceae bacterium]|nr:DUF1549 domain-containing protein [Pirellulaceae bacterium]
MPPHPACRLRPYANWQRIAPLAALIPLVALGLPADLARGELLVQPRRVTLDGPESSLQIVVRQSDSGGQLIDRTRQADYQLDALPLIAVDSQGRVRPLLEGTARLVVRVGDESVEVPVEVSGLSAPRPVSFRQEVIPLLTKAGCSSGGCHGKAEGQNGFKLSVFGYDPDADHAALVKEARGRRVHLAAPEHSLLLRKASAAMPHGGGRQVEPDSAAYGRLHRWIREGATLDDPRQRAAVTRITVEPAEQELELRGAQQLRVVAEDAAGVQFDVTAEADFESNDTTIAAVDQQGLVRAGEVPGEAAVLVRFMGQVAIARIALPRPGIEFRRPPEHNFVDRLVWDKLEQLGIQPSELADDATFLRRVYLDTIGTLPTPEEAREFLEDASEDKRARLIDRLLQRDEYATYWAMRWADILRVDSNALGSEPTLAVMHWLRGQFAENRPYDQFVRDIVTAAGSTRSQGPAAIYLALNEPREISRSFSQLFLGVRIECAECHHHPFERWSQHDFFALAGYFTGLKRKTIPGGAVLVYPDGGQDLRHPQTGELVPAAPLGAEPTAFEQGIETGTETLDRRLALADWLVSPDNPYFARTIANRLWAHYFGRGLVEPIDDLRATNPATNEPLLAALADHLRQQRYDLRALTRTLLNSRVYQLSAVTNVSNAGDWQHFSHARDRSLPAEVLLDAICQVTGVPEKFNGWPLGARAIEVWDNREPLYFFRIFGRPTRTTVCECERGDTPSVAQALHLMNSPEIMAKVQHRHGRARKLAASELAPPEIVEVLCLATLARYPSPEEQQVLLRPFQQPGAARREAIEDVLWVLLNSKEFIYNH